MSQSPEGSQADFHFCSRFCSQCQPIGCRNPPKGLRPISTPSSRPTPPPYCLYCRNPPKGLRPISTIILSVITFIDSSVMSQSLEGSQADCHWDGSSILSFPQDGRVAIPRRVSGRFPQASRLVRHSQLLRVVIPRRVSGRFPSVPSPPRMSVIWMRCRNPAKGLRPIRFHSPSSRRRAPAPLRCRNPPKGLRPISTPFTRFLGVMAAILSQSPEGSQADFHLLATSRPSSL